MESGESLRSDAFEVAAATYREAAAYVASFVAYASQHADLEDGALAVELAPAELTEQDRRALR